MSGSTSLFRQLRQIFGPANVYVADVVEVYADDTSLVQLPGPETLTQYAANVATGSLVRVRGSSVSVGGRVFIRSGVIESEAPGGPIADIEVGRVVAVQA